MDEKIWFYIIAAVIWYFVRRKKKTPEQEVPDTTASSRPQQQRKQVSFEDLLKEITEQREQENRPTPRPEPVYAAEEEDLPVRKMREEQERIAKEGSYRHFADEETRRVYEESIKQAEGFDIAFAPDEKFASKRLFKAKEATKERSFADEIREGLQKTDTARKAIVYGEILNRKY